MTTKFCLVGATSGELLTYKGWLLVHENKRELEYLFPGLKIVPKPKYYGDDMTMELKDHPDMDTVQFPLEQNMDQFRVPRRK